MKYVAFLRGINLGKRTVKMDDLRDAFCQLGLANAETLIASGNVLFESAGAPDVPKIKQGLEEYFGFAIGTIVRSVARLEQMIGRKPFHAYAAGPEVKFYVTLTGSPIGDRMADATSVDGEFDIVRIDDLEYYAVAFRQPDGRYGTRLLDFERRFRNLVITTRNWNTIERMVIKARKN